jgi:hypothetical protein
MTPKNNKKYLLGCSDIRPNEFRDGFECSFLAYYGKIEVEEYWSIPRDHIELSRERIMVEVSELGPKRSQVKIPLLGSRPKEFTVNTTDLEEIAKR